MAVLASLRNRWNKSGSDIWCQVHLVLTLALICDIGFLVYTKGFMFFACCLITGLLLLIEIIHETTSLKEETIVLKPSEAEILFLEITRPYECQGPQYYRVRGLPVVAMQHPLDSETFVLIIPKSILPETEDGKLIIRGPFPFIAGPLHTLRRFWCKLADPSSCRCSRTGLLPCFPKSGDVLFLVDDDHLPRVHSVYKWLQLSGRISNLHCFRTRARPSIMIDLFNINLPEQTPVSLPDALRNLGNGPNEMKSYETIVCKYNIS